MSLTDRLNRLASLNVGPAPQGAVTGLVTDLRTGQPMVIPPQELIVPRAHGLTPVARLARAQATVADPSQFSDVQRIVRMPVIRPFEPEEIDAFSSEKILAHEFRRGYRMLAPQANGLAAFMEYLGLLGAIGVGGGKTMLSLMCVEHAYRNGVAKSILSVPANAMNQLVKSDLQYARSKTPITVPFHILAGRNATDRKALASSGKKGCYIIPHTYFSTRDTSALLDAIGAGFLCLDEAHHFSNRASARTRRLLQFIEDFLPLCAFLSGTLTAKSVMDYFHLAKAALKNNCPLPLAGTLAMEWGAVIDATSPDEASRAQTGPIEPLIEWARAKYPQESVDYGRSGLRHAYCLRLNSTPGVVATGDSDVKASLYMCNVPVQNPERCEGYHQMIELMKQVRDAWLTPNGDEIEYNIHMYKWLYELTVGFYNMLIWPTIDELKSKRGISHDNAVEMLERAEMHRVLQQEYFRELRTWLGTHGRKGMDTPFLVAGEMSRHQGSTVGQSLFEKWQAMHAAKFQGMPERESVPVRVCPYKIDHAVAWAKGIKKDKGGLCWFYHNEVGDWLLEKFRYAGLDPVYAPAGDPYNDIICALFDPNRHGKGDRIVIASITGHGTAKNLQMSENTHFVQWPRSARLAEQCIGRNHRTGSPYDELIMLTNHTTDFDSGNFAATLNDAAYAQQSMGNRQRLLYANYDPLPVIYPDEFLQERGFENIPLPPDAKRLLMEKFAPDQAAA